MILAFQNRKKIQAFAQGCNATWTDLAGITSNTQWPMIFSGITTMAPIVQAQKYSLDYWYIDTGYIGNTKVKKYLRVCKNSIHANSPIISRPSDRLNRLQIDRTKIQRGSRIMLIPPDAKQAAHFAIDSVDVWLQQTINLITQVTDRPLIIRQRPPSRTARMTSDTLIQALNQDIHAIVTLISNSAVEAVLHDIPVISLGPSACVQVSPWGLDQIDNVPDIDTSLKEAWLRHLSYNQFTFDEMSDGTAWRILNEG